MAEHFPFQERVPQLQNDLKRAEAIPEQSGVREDAIESPEEKQEREYRENVTRLAERAHQYIEEQKRERQSRIQPTVTAEVQEPAPLPTLATARAELEKSRGTVSALKKGVKHFRLRFSGVEKPEDLMALAQYLEQHLINREYHHITVKASRKEREIKKYERKGYEVHDVYDSHRPGEVRFTIEKEVPYRVSPQEEKKLGDLLGKSNDPVTIIERLKQVGFHIDAHTMHYHINALEEFVASSEINDVLEKLARAGVKSDHLYFGYGDDTARRLGMVDGYVAGLIKEYAFNPHRQEEMSEENLQKIARLKQLSFEIRFGDHWGDIIKMVSDDDTFTLLSFMAERSRREGPGNSSYRQEQWNETVLLRDAGLAGEFAEIIRTSPRLAQKILYELSHGDYFRYPHEKREEKKIESAKALLALPVVAEMRTDPTLAAFVDDVATLIEKAPNIENMELYNMELYKELRAYPETIPFLELCRELGISSFQIKDIHHSQPSDLHTILVRQEILRDAFRPEFQEFMSRMKDDLGYQIRQEDFIQYTNGLSAAGKIVQLSQNPIWREGIASGRAPKLIKKFGDFDVSQVYFYTTILEIPNSLEILNQLEQKLQFDGTKVLERYGVRFDTFEFRQLCENEDLQNHLFDEQTILFYQQLKDGFEYKLKFSEIDSLWKMAQDIELSELLAIPENQVFIKETFSYPEELVSIARIKDVDDKFKPLIHTLAKGHFYFRYGANKNEDINIPLLYDEQEIVLPISKELTDHIIEYKIDFRILRDISKLKHTERHGLIGLFEKVKDHIGICNYIFHNGEMLVKDQSDVRFIETVLQTHGKRGDAILKEYMKCLEAGAVTYRNKNDVLEFLQDFRILSPAIIKGYIAAKQTGTREIFMTHLKSVGERLTGSGTVTNEERKLPYFQDLLREVYQNNSGNWTTYENNESCTDRSKDIEAFTIRPRYEVDLLSASAITVKEGETLNMQSIENLKNEILVVAEKMQGLEYDTEKAKAAVEEELDAALVIIRENEGQESTGVENTYSAEEKLFLVMLDGIYGTNALNSEHLRSLLIFYEFAHFEDIRDYIQGTSERVSGASNQDYALLCELNTFFSDRIKEVNKRLVQSGFSNETIQAKMPDYFKRLSLDTLRKERENVTNRLQVEKLGLTDDFIRQITRTLRGKTGKTYTPEQVKRIIGAYESSTQGLRERASTSPKSRTKAFYGQLKSQRDKTLQAVKTITGTELLPEEIHLGQIDIGQLIETEVNIQEGQYDEEQFASYTMQKFSNLFIDEQNTVEQELGKFQSAEGTKREVLFGYIAKNRESAHARMVGGVCVSGDNPQKAGAECMWNMPNYFQLVLQDPETYRCVGLVLLHHFVDEEGKKVLTASINPSSTYLYSVDEKALCRSLVETLKTFSQENDIDKILLSKNKQIRTNRTGGTFEQEMDSLIAGVDKTHTFSEPKRFSYSPSYFMDQLDVIWEKGAT